jgi:hypothetical protein
MDGRVLSEAMLTRQRRSPSETKTLAAQKHFPSGNWKQTTQISRVGSTLYLDQGNGAFLTSHGRD